MKKPIPILPEAVTGIIPVAGTDAIGAYHGYGTTIGTVDPKTGEIMTQAIIIAGSVEDLREQIALVVPTHKFNPDMVHKLTVVGTDYVIMQDSDL